jgi:hypothetical protein
MLSAMRTTSHSAGELEGFPYSSEFTAALI